MALSAKAIKSRIRSVKNTRKITKAMEMVAASKMKKAVGQSLASLVYAERALELLMHIAKDRVVKHPLLRKAEGKKVLLVIVASNKGLCGGYHVNLFKEVALYLATKKQLSAVVEVLCVGRYAERFARKMGLTVIASFIDIPDVIRAEDVRIITGLIIDEFIEGNYDKVRIAFTRFVSALKSEVNIRGILPIKQENVRRVILKEADSHLVSAHGIESLALYIFEPGEEAVLDYVLPRLTEAQVYQAFLEARAAEHSSRMVAMKNASDNAGEFIDELTLRYNKARQAAITQEIVEIATAAGAIG